MRSRTNQELDEICEAADAKLMFIQIRWDFWDAWVNFLQPLSRFAREPNSICLYNLHQNTKLTCKAKRAASRNLHV